MTPGLLFAPSQTEFELWKNKRLMKKARLKIGVFTLVLSFSLLQVPSGHAQGDTPSEIEKIRQNRAATNESLHNFDIHKETHHYTEDYTIATSSGVKINGKKAYIQRYEKDSSGVYTRSPGEIRISVNDTVAYETGEWEAQQPEKRFGGSYTAQWVKKDRAWKVQSEIYILLWVDE